jgi:DDE family transposase
MDLSTFIISVYCLIDEWLAAQPRLRQRGFAPALSDSEVLTMEAVGEFLGIDTDAGLYRHFRQHYADWFPALRRVDRSTFARQAANLWAVKGRLWQHLGRQVAHDPALSIVDSFPIPVCRFARARRCRRLRAESAYGHDHIDQRTFYGLRAHVRICWPGLLVCGSLAPANADEMEVAEHELLDVAHGWVLGDRNYWRPEAAARLRRRDIVLLAPYKWASREREPWPQWLTDTRRRIETVIGQLTERYQAKRVWARDAWHLLSRWLRKVLSHTVAVLLCQRAGLSPLAFDELVTAE